MDEQGYIQICSIKKEKGVWNFYDCKNDMLPSPSEERIFTSAMKRRYYEKIQKREKGISTVWVLVGFKEDGGETWEQVGRTKDLKNSLDEIRENVKQFYNSDKKYGALKNKKYHKLVFYEVDIDKYLQDDLLFKAMYGEPPKDSFFSLAYYFIRAAYVEGKLGCEKSACMYRKSSLDEYFYSYYKSMDRIKDI